MTWYIRQLFQVLLLIILVIACTSVPDNIAVESRKANIFPDYQGTVIPSNIAPLNFIIREPGENYSAVFTTEDEDYSFRISSSDSIIIIPEKKWKKLLNHSEGKTFHLTITIKNNGDWKKFSPLNNTVAAATIDPYIAYRRINPGMVFWDNMTIVQRSLEDFQEFDIISNQNTEKNCIHCHTFQDRNPESFLLHIRMAPGGTLIKRAGTTHWLNTKTPYTLSSFVYPSWHPNGRFIAFSTNKIHQNFFGKGKRINHVRDNASDIVIYDIDSNLVFTSPELASFDFENIPAWSPGGDFLYFIRSPREHKYLPDSAEKYDLMRIAFDAESKVFGRAETLLSSKETGLSVSFPQISPNGKFLIFCMADYGYFNINNNSSELYLMDLSDFSYKKLPVNSEETESWPNWSDNSHWIMFTTKRIDGMYTVPHFAYVDSLGEASKPFPLPFKNPESYFTRITNLNRPVFLTGKVKFTQEELQEIVYSHTENVIFDSLGVDIDALSGATTIDEVSHGSNVLYLRD